MEALIPFLGGAICGACLLGFILLCRENVKASRVTVTRVKTFVPQRPGWFCLGPCESEQHTERPDDGLCFLCRLGLHGDGVPA